MLPLCGFTCLDLIADAAKSPYIIHRGEEIIEVSKMPKFTVSDPITNSFVYINGEYTPPPYVVSVSNLVVLINGIIVNDLEPRVHKREYYTRRVGTLPETVGDVVDEYAESYVRSLKLGTVTHIAHGGIIRGYLMRDGDESALAYVKKARKAMQGDEQAKRELIEEMGLENSMSKVRPDWIQRLANNTNLEIRVTRILEAKRLKEQKEKERREQQNPQDKR